VTDSAHKALALAVLSAVVFVGQPASSHLAGYSRSNTGMTVRNHWGTSFPIRWNINPNTGENIKGSGNVADVIQASFQTWLQAPNTTLSASRGPNSTASSSDNSPGDQNVICFICSADFGGDETLAITFTRIVSGAGATDGHGGVTQFPGQIIKADIFFNPDTAYSTGGGGGAEDEDLQTVATHEIGHFFGLDHSAVVRAVMFPFAPNSLQTLSYDDVAGISVLYPKSTPDFPAGVIAGTVRMATSSSPVFGAHVYANSLTSADAFPGRNIRKTPIGTLTFPDGTYRIEGLPPDSYTVIAEPLDDPVTSDDVPEYGTTFGSSIQTNFTTRWR
jgi:Matrixin